MADVPETKARPPRHAILPIVSELVIGALLALGATGFTYAFVKRAFLSGDKEASLSYEDEESDAASSSSFGAGASAPVEPAAAPGQAIAAVKNIYPLPDSEVLGSGTDLASSRLGYTETLVGWGVAVDGLLEIREDSPTGRAHFVPLRNQGVARAKLRAGKRYVWRVLSQEDDGARQKIVAGPYRFTLKGSP